MIWMIFKNTIYKYKNIEDYNLSRKQKILIHLIWLLIWLIIKPILIVTELFITGRKLNISLISITQSYFAVSKNIILV